MAIALNDFGLVSLCNIAFQKAEYSNLRDKINAKLFVGATIDQIDSDLGVSYETGSNVYLSGVQRYLDAGVRLVRCAT
jgi:hypothetical protein